MYLSSANLNLQKLAEFFLFVYAFARWVQWWKIGARRSISWHCIIYLALGSSSAVHYPFNISRLPHIFRCDNFPTSTLDLCIIHPWLEMDPLHSLGKKINKVIEEKVQRSPARRMVRKLFKYALTWLLVYCQRPDVNKATCFQQKGNTSYYALHKVQHCTCDNPNTFF